VIAVFVGEELDLYRFAVLRKPMTAPARKLCRVIAAGNCDSDDAATVGKNNSIGF
jgi:hypothetical protein